MMPNRYDKIVKFLLWAAGIFLLLIVFVSNRDPRQMSWDLGPGPKIGVVEVKGIIYDSEQVVRRLDRLQRRDEIEGMVVRIDSPGGTVAASQEIYSKIKNIVETDERFLIVSMGTVAASGGLYIALAADTIMANPGTTTGSIGVIVDYPVAEDFLEKIGIQVEVIKSGALKDAGSPYRTSTTADRASFQRVVDDLYEQFVTVVAEERELTEENVRKFATGEVFSGRQAQKLNLVDILGSYEDAINLAGALTGNFERPVVIKPAAERRKSFLRYLLDEGVEGSLTPQLLPQYRMR
ncbi:signal peptide peptidase SppA [Candidatus Neomarinimicrobiota bacterium]